MKQKPLPRLPRGMGSYTYRKPGADGKSLIQFSKAAGPPEARKRLTVYGATVAECNERMRKAELTYEREAEKGREKDPRNAGLTFKAGLRNWMAVYKRPQLKPRSYDTLEGILERYVETAPFANKQIEQVTDTDIQLWLSGIEERLSLSTARKCRSLAAMYMDFYYARRPTDNPMLTVPKIRKDPAKTEWKGAASGEDGILNDEEIERLESALREERGTGRPVYRHGMMLSFIMWTFLRYGEAAALTWGDADTEKGLLTVNKSLQRVRTRTEDGERARGRGNSTHLEVGTPKTLSSSRTVMLCAQAADALSEYGRLNPEGREPGDLIFTTSGGEPVSDQYANEMLSSALKRAGIAKHVTLHGLRHTGISYFLRHGVDREVVSRMAGHSSVSTTNDIYYSLTEKQVRNEVAKVSRERK